MATQLSTIKPTLQKYTEVLSQVLKVDVEITDTDFIRVAASGKISNTIGKNVSRESVTIQHTISSGEILIVNNPGKDAVCQECYRRNTCKEKFEIAIPIKCNNIVVGVIGFVCYTEQQRKHVVKNLDSFLEMISQISQLIEFKLIEDEQLIQIKQMSDLMDRIIDLMNIGLIVYDNNENILQINTYGKKILNFDKFENQINDIKIKETGNNIRDIKEYGIVYKNKHLFILGESYDNILNNKNNIIVFKEEDCSNTKLTIGKDYFGISKLFGDSTTINNFKEEIKQISNLEENIFLKSNNGNDKEFYAKIIHEESPRFKGAFIYFNCHNNNDVISNYELFGNSKNKGKFHQSYKGTIFIDNIEQLSIKNQNTLLELLKTKDQSRRRAKEFPTIISSSDADLKQLCSENTFLWELYYRLNILTLSLPSINERKSDIKYISQFKLLRSGIKEKQIKTINEDIWNKLRNHNFEGNDFELDYLTKKIGVYLKQNNSIDKNIFDTDSTPEVEENFNLEYIEKETIQKAMNLYGTNFKSKQIVAQKLGIGIATLYKKLKYYGLEN